MFQPRLQWEAAVRNSSFLLHSIASSKYVINVSFNEQKVKGPFIK